MNTYKKCVTVPFSIYKLMSPFFFLNLHFASQFFLYKNLVICHVRKYLTIQNTGLLNGSAKFYYGACKYITTRTCLS